MLTNPLQRLPGFDPTAPLLDIDKLHVQFVGSGAPTRAVNGVSLTLDPGKTLAVLGESGSGKSVTARAVLGLVSPPRGRITQGTIRLHGVDLQRLTPAQLRTTRGSVAAMIFQDALSALNPVFSVGNQIAEALRNNASMTRADTRRRTVQLLERVRIPDAAHRVHDYPHQFSGGMRQRVMIAMAVAMEPLLLIADEPTTALDVTVQAQIMRLLAELQRERGMGLVLISHDMGVVAGMADHVAVMYAGRIVEQGPVAEVYARPAHPYTHGLLESVPQGKNRGQRLRAIPGSPPDLARLSPGCAFAPRCAYVFDRCREDRPQLLPVDSAHSSACHLREKMVGR